MGGTVDFTRSFAVDYAGARAKFRAEAQSVGAALASYRHTSATGPADEPLFIDVARLGDPRASRQLVIISGTHGLEGISGSAAQIAWLQTRPRLPRGVSVLLIHALNPYGFAHATRTTENNVDLNRNFVDHSRSHPENPAYARLQASSWTCCFAVCSTWHGRRRCGRCSEASVT